jgi:hypothetical protein
MRFFSCLEMPKIMPFAIVSVIRFIHILIATFFTVTANKLILENFLIPCVLSRIDASQIDNSVISFVSVNMVNDIWFFVVNQLPNNPM